jgi:succinyl-CoA synthetase beta subunit
MFEINPVLKHLIIKLWLVDAKVNDDNALYRQKLMLKCILEENPIEVEAKE